MHEYSIVQALFDQIQDVAARTRRGGRAARDGADRRDGRRRSRAAAHGVRPVPRSHTICEHAPLDVETVAARWTCPDGHGDIEPRRARCVCATCAQAGAPGGRRRNRAETNRTRGAVMCEACGCGDSNVVPVAFNERILAANDRAARHNREHFRERGVSAINLMGSPGAGKTAVLEATARGARPRRHDRRAGRRSRDRQRRAAHPRRRHSSPSRSPPAPPVTSTRRWCTTGCTGWPRGGTSTISSSRTSATSSVPAVYDLGQDVQRRRAVGDRRRRQAAQVSDDVPEGGPGAAHQDRSAADAARDQHRGDPRQPVDRHARAAHDPGVGA